jgi:hypothetical protein
MPKAIAIVELKNGMFFRLIYVLKTLVQDMFSEE